MTQGIFSLMRNGQAPQNPGQAAPAQVMPPQQGQNAGIAQVPALVQADINKLLALHQNPALLKGTPFSLYGVIGALSEKLKAENAKIDAQNNAATNAYGQQVQQPSVAEGLAQQVAAISRPTQFARHGGIMHGYAGGGAVAFNQGGSPFGRWFQQISEESQTDADQRREKFRLKEALRNKYGWSASPIGLFMSQSDADRAEAKDVISRLPNMSMDEMYTILGERPPVAPGTENYSHEGQVGLASKPVPPVPYAPVVPESQKDTRQIPPSEVRASAPAGPARPLSTGAAAPAGIASVANQVTLPALDPYYAQQAKEAEELARSKTEMMKAQGVVSPEVLASRERLRQAQQSAYEPQRKALEEAKAERDAGLFGNAEALGRMAAAVGGTKRFGQGLAAAAGAGSEVVARQRERIEKLSDRYNDLQAQLNLTMAQAQHADVVGDDALKRKALADAEAIKMELFNTKNALHSAAYSQRAQEVQGIAALSNAQSAARTARAHEISAGKPDAMSALIGLVRQGTSMSPLEAYTAIRQADQSKRNAFDQISDNARANYNKWLENPRNMSATAEQRKAAFDEFLNQEIELAKRFNVPGVPSGTSPPVVGKTMTMNDVQATARASGKTPEEVRKAAIAAGYTIQ